MNPRRTTGLRGAARWLGPALAGVIGAAAFGVVSRRLDASEHARAPRAAVEESAAASTDVEALVDRRIAALSGALATRPAEAAAPAPAERPARPSLEDRARQTELEQRDHEARLAQHADEPRVDAWAPEMERQVASAFRGLPSDGATRYEGVDCRSHSCVATLSWASFEEARGAMQAAISAGSGAGCAQRLTLPAPGAAPGRYEAHLLMECAPAQN